jgi:hypothetical protein
MGQLKSSETAQKILIRLIEECDPQGVWNPPNLRVFSKSPSGMAEFFYPLEVESKNPDHRKTDVTFRLALIAKLAGWTLEFT